MKSIFQSIASARRRLYAQNLLSASGWLIIIALCSVLILFLTDRVLGVPVSKNWYTPIAGLMILLGPLWAWKKNPSDQTTAAMIDERLGLKDRLGSSLYASSIQAENPLARCVMRDAQTAAEKIDLSSGFPIRFTSVWVYVPPLAAVLAVLILYLPQMDLLGLTADRDKQATEKAQAQIAREDLELAVATIEQIDITAPESNPLDDDLDQDLKELAEMTRKDLSNPQLKREAEIRLSQAQQSLAQKAEDQQKQLDQLDNALSRLDPETPGPGDAFVESLRRGDLDSAREQIQQLADQVADMTKEDQQALKNQLQDLAQQLQDIAQQQSQNADQIAKLTEQQLRDAGLSQEQIHQLQQNGFDPQQVQKQLQNQGMTPQQAQRMAEQIKQSHQQQSQHQNTGKRSEDLSSGMQQMSQSMSPSSNPSSQQQQSFKQGSDATDQTLNQMAQMREQINQMRRAQSQCQRAMDQLNGNPQQGSGGQQSTPKNTPGSGSSSQRLTSKNNSHSRGAGNTDGGNPIGEHRQTGPYQTSAEGDPNEGQGRVIASWLGEGGETVKGDPTVDFDQARTQARLDAEQAVTEDRVPHRYHETIREYFNQLPQSPDEIKSAPAAPR